MEASQTVNKHNPIDIEGKIRNAGPLHCWYDLQNENEAMRALAQVSLFIWSNVGLCLA